MRRKFLYWVTFESYGETQGIVVAAVGCTLTSAIRDAVKRFNTLEYYTARPGDICCIYKKGQINES